MIDWERLLVDCGLMPSLKERILQWLIICAINIVWMFLAYKCFENENYPLGIVLSVLYLGWKCS